MIAHQWVLDEEGQIVQVIYCSWTELPQREAADVNYWCSISTTCTLLLSVW